MKKLILRWEAPMIPGMPAHYRGNKNSAKQPRARDPRKPQTACPTVLPTPADLDAYVAKAAEDEKARTSTSK